MKWEYHIQDLNELKNGHEAAKTLSKLGFDGWKCRFLQEHGGIYVIQEAFGLSFSQQRETP
jgi:hypothetical protein